MSACHQRCVKLLKYIDENLDQALDIALLSRRASVSEFHLQRLFREISGLSVAQYIKLRRFKRAVYQLGFRPGLRVQEVAVQAGYDSAEAFSRAFKQLLGQSPSEFRQSPDWAAWQSASLGLEQDPQSEAFMNAVEYHVELVEVPSLSLVVYEHRGSPRNLPGSIATFIEWRRARQLPPSRSRTFNLVYDDMETTPPEAFRFDLAVAVEQDYELDRPGFVHKQLPGGRCARIRHQGGDAGLGPAVRYLYGPWLAAQGYELRDFPLFFERVRFFPDVPEPMAITDIYLPLK